MKARASSAIRHVIFLALALPVGASGQDRSHAGIPAATEPTCEVARGDGFVITHRDVEELRAALSPSPPFGTASRLAVDVAVAQWLAKGRVEPMPPREELRLYRAKVVELIAQQGTDGLAQAFREAREELRVELGPCYVELRGREDNPLDRQGDLK